MKKENLINEYSYYYESYLYYDILKKDKMYTEINLGKCNLLADLFLRYYNGEIEELQKISLQINEDFKNKHPEIKFNEDKNEE